MKITPYDSYLHSLNPEIEEAVRRNLRGTELGHEQDWTSPLIPDKDEPTQGRRMRIAEVSKWLYSTGLEWLDDIEHDAEEKIGPESIQLPYRKRTEVVYDYFDQPDIRPDRGAWSYAVERLTNLVNMPMRPSTLETAYGEMPKGTNLGLPFASADAEYRPQVLALARDIRDMNYEVVLDPCILYWRGQSRGLTETPKQRTVWGYPHAYTLFELQLQIPMLAVLRRKFEFAAWNEPDAINRAVTFVMVNSPYDILSVDFSRFDASVPAIVIKQIFAIIREWFTPEAYSLIEFVERAFLTIGLLTPEGILSDRNGGVPSGSGVTNLIDSLVQLFAFYYIGYRMRNSVVMHLVQGDDGVVTFERPWSLDDVTGFALELGLKVSSDKGGVSKQRVSFLQNIHSLDWEKDGIYPGIRPVMRVLGKALSYERFKSHWNGADDTLRWIQQWTALKDHPKFREAVNFLWEHDEYLRKYSLALLIKKAGGLANAESALDLNAFKFGKLPLREYGNSPVLREVQRLRSKEGVKRMSRA